VSISSVLFIIAAALMLVGICCVALTAALFKESDTGKTQDVYGMDTPEDRSHWPLLWSGAIMFGFGVMTCFIGSIAYLLEKI